MKRTPRSFTVEIRNSGRKESPVPHRALQTARAIPAPRVAFVPDGEAPKPWKTARVLPALEPSPPPASQTLGAPADTLPVEQEDTDIEWAEGGMAAEPDEIAGDLFLEDDDIITDPKPVTRIIPQRVPKPSLLRQTFSRAERWKHRLPKVIQRRSVKPAS